jgi:hypothetical protein
MILTYGMAAAGTNFTARTSIRHRAAPDTAYPVEFPRMTDSMAIEPPADTSAMACYSNFPSRAWL